MSETICDRLAMKFYIDPHYHPLRVAARNAYALGQWRIVKVRAIIKAHSNTPRPLSIFDATILNCQQSASALVTAQALAAREQEARVRRNTRKRTEWKECI